MTFKYWFYLNFHILTNFVKKKNWVTISVVQLVIDHMLHFYSCKINFTRDSLPKHILIIVSNESDKGTRVDKLEKLVILLVITGHGEHLFNSLLNHSGLFADIDAVQEFPDVLLSDRGGLLDQGRWEKKKEKPINK